MKKRPISGLATEKTSQARIKRLLDAAEANFLPVPQRPAQRQDANKQKAA